MLVRPETIDHLDRIIEKTACRLSIDDIADLIFGGLMGQPGSADLFDDIVEVGIELRKWAAMPLATPVPPEVGFYLVCWAVERLTDMRIGEGAKGIDKAMRRIEKIERRHGTGGDQEPWRVDEGPPKWQAANREWERISDEIFVECLRPLAADMADLLVDDREEFDRRRKVGHVNFARLTGHEDVLRRIDDLLPDIPEEA